MLLPNYFPSLHLRNPNTCINHSLLQFCHKCVQKHYVSFSLILQSILMQSSYRLFSVTLYTQDYVPECTFVDLLHSNSFKMMVFWTVLLMTVGPYIQTFIRHHDFIKELYYSLLLWAQYNGMHCSTVFEIVSFYFLSVWWKWTDIVNLICVFLHVNKLIPLMKL